MVEVLPVLGSGALPLASIVAIVAIAFVRALPGIPPIIRALNNRTLAKAFARTMATPGAASVQLAARIMIEHERCAAGRPGDGEPVFAAGSAHRREPGDGSAAFWSDAGPGPRDDAARWVGRSVPIDRFTDPELRRYIAPMLARVGLQFDEGDSVGALRTRLDALRLVETVDDHEIQARALTAIGTVLRRRAFNVVDREMVARIERELSRLPPADSPLRARLLATLALECYDGSADPRCDAKSAAAIAIARRLDDLPLLAETLVARYGATRRPDSIEELAAVGAELVAMDVAHGMRAAGVAGRLMLISVYTQRFDLAAADAAARECDQLLGRLRLPALQLLHDSWHAARLTLDASFNAAEQAYAACAHDQHHLGQVDVDLWFACVRAVLWFQQGRYAEAAELLNKHVAAVPWLAHDLRVLASRDKPSGEWPALPHDFMGLTAAVVRAEATIHAGDTREQLATYNLLRPFATQLAIGGSSFLPGPVDLYLGRLAGELGRDEARRRHLAAAGAACEHAGLHWWADRVREA